MSDELIVRFCSPTLARLKTGNLFNCRYETLDELYREIKSYNQAMADKGVEMCVLNHSKRRALVYIYRKDWLANDLKNPRIAGLMACRGYDCDSIDGYIKHLSYRIQTQSEFPHEIGVFLGYPAEDVIAFIQYKGKCSKCVGCWKVYGDLEKAMETFNRYKKCTEIYRKKVKKGLSIRRLTVAA